MAVWSIRCGNCGDGVSADVVFGWPGGSVVQQEMEAPRSTLWLRCPSCLEGSVKLGNGAVYPTAPAGGAVQYLPADVDQAWREARSSHAVAAYTAAEMVCRKILMHLAVDRANSSAGKSFAEYVDDLEDAGYIVTGLKGTVDQIRQRGNTANHELPASTESESLQTLGITEYLLKGAYELAGPPPPPEAPPT